MGTSYRLSRPIYYKRLAPHSSLTILGFSAGRYMMSFLHFLIHSMVQYYNFDKSRSLALEFALS